MSIYETLKQNIAAELPDQKELTLRSGEIWVPGAFEGTLLRGNYSIGQYSFVNYWVALKIKKFVLNPTAANFKKLEDTISRYSAISLADPVLSFLSRMKLEQGALQKAALKLAQNSSHREPVKFAMTLLGSCETGMEETVETLKILTSHEEFTMFGLVALKNILPKEEADRILLELGTRLSGWGKIALLYELDYDLPEVRSWKLQKGCSNTICLSYLANVCAIKGKMKDYLQALEDTGEGLDTAFAEGILHIFQGLLECHPENDSIYEYPEAVESSQLLRSVLERSSPEVQEAFRDVIGLLDEKRIG